MDTVFLLIMFLIIGFIGGIAVSCGTFIKKIEKATGTHNTHDAVNYINNLNHDITHLTKEVNQYSGQIKGMNNKVQNTLDQTKDKKDHHIPKHMAKN